MLKSSFEPCIPTASCLELSAFFGVALATLLATNLAIERCWLRLLIRLMSWRPRSRSGRRSKAR